MTKSDDSERTLILVVDDDHMVLKTLSLLIEAIGYNCHSAANGLEAIEMMKKTKYDLVVSDVRMPGMDGIQLLHHIKENHPKTDVIIATGFSEQATYADVINAGAMDYLKKPIDRAELEAKLARALRERHMVHKLELLSMYDCLTSLLNRRAFDIHLHQELERAVRQKYSLFLAMLDVDNFKAYNDKHGHQRGDNVLIFLGETLIECTRNSVDMCFRIGGDEFAILLPQTTAEQAKEVVERILAQYNQRHFDNTSLSVGITQCERNLSINIEEDLKQIKDCADKAMYEAKHKGKGQIVFRE